MEGRKEGRKEGKKERKKERKIERTAPWGFYWIDSQYSQNQRRPLIFSYVFDNQPLRLEGFLTVRQQPFQTSEGKDEVAAHKT